MCDPVVIERLYANVLHEDILRNRVTTDDIRKGIGIMREVYKPDPTSLESSTLDIADYNIAAHRCAYLHKYAPLHTALTAVVIEKVLIHNMKCFKDLLNKNGHLNVCSIGGGPGCDVIAVLAVLHEYLGYFQLNATIVDIMIGWRHTFHSILQELKYGEYGMLSDHVSEQYLNWSYEEANLIGKMTNGANKAIGSAHLITMVKFVSASSCQDTPNMIGKIFRSMKQGSLVLYIDNAGGGFHQMVRKQAQACNLITIFGPQKHETYNNQTFNVKRFGYTPCLETKVTIHVWRKPLQVDALDAYRIDNWSQESGTDFDAGQTTIACKINKVRDQLPVTGWDNGYRELVNPVPAYRVPPSRAPRRSRSRSNQRRPVQHQPRAQAEYNSAQTDANSSPERDDCCSSCVIS